MKTTAGLWIDHRKAVIAIVSAEGERTLEIKSNIEKQAGRLEGVRSTAHYEAQLVPADDSREREFTGELHGYYDEVIAAIRDAEQGACQKCWGGPIRRSVDALPPERPSRLRVALRRSGEPLPTPP